MCQMVKCPTCGKADRRGCGAHVEQVLGHVPKTERCKCREKGASAGGPKPPSKLPWPFG
jgi:hypothetical protein